MRVSESHSLKLTGGGGFLGSMRTTDDSTFGGGRKLFLPTLEGEGNENTVKSRYNGFQGTGENHPLLPKSVIAKMTMVD